MASIKAAGDFQFTVERQTAWGTAISTAPIGIPGTIEFAAPRDEITVERYRGVRTPQALDSLITTGMKTGTAKTSCMATAQLINVFAPALFQKAADWTAATNVWTLWPVALGDLPSCKATNGTAGTGGYVYTLTEQNPTVLMSRRMINCVPSNVKFSLSPTAHEGVLWMDIDWIGQSYVEGVTPAGAAAVVQAPYLNVYRFHEYDLFGWDAVVATGELTNYELNLSWGAKYVADLPNGDVVFPAFTATGSFSMVGGTNAETMRGHAMSTVAGVSYALKLQFGDGTVSTAGELNFENYMQPVGEPTVERADGEIYTFNFKGVEDVVTTRDATGQYPAKLTYFYSAA